MVALRQTETDHITAQVVSETIEKQGSALIETVAGTKRLVAVAKQYINCASDQTQGRMFEIIETTKFNVNAAKAGSLLRVVTTDELGQPHAAADLLIRNPNGEVLKEIQAKSYRTAPTAARAIANPKYNGMDRLVNVEKAERVSELVEKRMNSQGIYAQDYKDAYGDITGETYYESISSGGTTYQEAMDAAENAETFAAKMNRTELITGIQSAMLSGALAGAFIGGTVSATQGYFKDNFCVKETGKAAANSAARGSVVAGISYGIKYLGKNNPIVNGNVAGALASSAVNMTELTYKFLTNKITVDEYVTGLGSNAVSCFSGVILTAAGAALFGPIGAAVAGTVGLIAMKQLYKVFEAVRGDVELAREARLQAEALSELLIAEIKAEEARLIAYYKEYSQTLQDLKTLVDLAVADSSFTEKAIVALADGLAIEFQYNTLEEFQDFMLSDDRLEL
ncbi:hypothetical protein I6G82_03500 [Lysinibacillus macroides]|uniref:Uncharacterized protein n=1 Tax=Lysinibacillus macroides TaxID=33935 RepID=A0A0M9DI87_9BACI|nr:hypothetical protein [Lysinibacillus macroides]KOY81133.1 hypothetical protein ADM90_18470 [Lysinibacillus macroides]QPR68714.1 hypothetical protein I6G82_03500 [Lysinibacillus macroides]